MPLPGFVVPVDHIRPERYCTRRSVVAKHVASIARKPRVHRPSRIPSGVPLTRTQLVPSSATKLRSRDIAVFTSVLIHPRICNVVIYLVHEHAPPKPTILQHKGTDTQASHEYEAAKHKHIVKNASNPTNDGEDSEPYCSNSRGIMLSKNKSARDRIESIHCGDHG